MRDSRQPRASQHLWECVYRLKYDIQKVSEIVVRYVYESRGIDVYGRFANDVLQEGIKTEAMVAEHAKKRRIASVICSCRERLA